MNYILEKTNLVPYFTNMRITLDALGILAAKYDWYVSDIEMNHFTADFNQDDKWILGEDLQHFFGKS